MVFHRPWGEKGRLQNYKTKKINNLKCGRWVENAFISTNQIWTSGSSFQINKQTLFYWAVYQNRHFSSFQMKDLVDKPFNFGLSTAW